MCTERKVTGLFVLTSFLCDNGVICHAFLSSADFFSKSIFSKILSRIPSECQTVSIQTKPDDLSGLAWVQTVCKDYQQTSHWNDAGFTG